MEKNLCSIGDVLVSLRIKKGLRRGKDFAKLMGISSSFLSKIERGHAHMTLARLSAYAGALSLEPIDVIECWFKEHPRYNDQSKNEQWEQFRLVIQDLLIVLDKGYC